MIQDNPLLKDAITFKLNKYGEDIEIDENELPLYEKQTVPNRELLKVEKIGIPGKKESNKVSNFWQRLKKQATINANF